MSGAPSQSAEPGRGGVPSRIERRLSAFDAAMVVVSLVIGIGIFRTPAIVAGAAGTSQRFFAAWLVVGLLSAFGALAYAEIGSRLPRAGGYYRVVADCYHPMLAFMLNWAQALMQGAGAAGVAFIGAEYLGLIVLAEGQRGPRAVLAVAFALMLSLLALNFAGIRTGARTQNVLSLLKVGMILALAVAGLLAAGAGLPVAGAPAAAGSAAPAAAPAPVLGLWLIAAAVPAFYSYGGYQNAINLAGDVRRPRRGVPLAITSGMAVVIALYLLINLAYERGLGISGVAGETLVAAALARRALGPSGEGFVALAIFLSAAGFVNATILQMPRSYYAMAEDGALPAAFLRVNPRTQVQEVGLGFFAATMLLPTLILGSFEKLLSYVMFTDALSLAIVASCVFVLRRRGVGAGDRDVFRTPGYPLLPGAYVLALLCVAAHVLVSETGLALAGLLVMGAGAPLFAMARRFARAHAAGPGAPGAGSL